MFKKYLIPLLLVFSFTYFLSSCKKESTADESTTGSQLDEVLKLSSGGVGRSFYKMPSSGDYANIPQDPNNPLSDAKVDLGAFLYHETGLSLNPRYAVGARTYSCASCHHEKAGFQAGVAQGLAEGGIGFGVKGEARHPDMSYPNTDSIDAPMIRSPSSMNMAYQENIMWNGQFGATGLNAGTQASWTQGSPLYFNFLGYQGIETQAIAGQNVHHLEVDTVFLQSSPIYMDLFNRAFSNLPLGQRVNRTTIGLAIAAYERTLLANQSPWQQWLDGTTTAMSEDELKGAVLFFGKANCVSCHNGPALANMEFYALGMKDLVNGTDGVINVDPNDPIHKGRGGFTHNSAEYYRFKSPQLYNLTDSKFYGHGASFKTVRAVVEYFNNGVKENTKVPTNALDPSFVPLNLSSDEIGYITLFLEKSLYDANLYRYAPSMLPTGNCYPNADAQSKADMGCN
ncbi:cytochrome c peroxidase [soil metagenome]